MEEGALTFSPLAQHGSAAGESISKVLRGVLVLEGGSRWHLDMRDKGTGRALSEMVLPSILRAQEENDPWLFEQTTMGTRMGSTAHLPVLPNPSPQRHYSS